MSRRSHVHQLVSASPQMLISMWSHACCHLSRWHLMNVNTCWWRGRKWHVSLRTSAPPDLGREGRMEQGGARHFRLLVNVKPDGMGTRFLLRGEWLCGSVPVSASGYLGACVPVCRRSPGDYLQLIKTASCVFVAFTFSPVLFILTSRLLEGHMSSILHKPLIGLCQFKKWGQPGREVPQKVQAAAESCPGLRPHEWRPTPRVGCL